MNLNQFLKHNSGLCFNTPFLSEISPPLNLIKLDVTDFIFDTDMSIVLFDCRQSSWDSDHMEEFKGVPLIKIPSINALITNVFF